jgi:hypothetical protein
MMAAEPETAPRFIHRSKPGVVWESICTLCFRTIGIEKEESLLSAAEEAHVCGKEDASPTRWRWEHGENA